MGDPLERSVPGCAALCQPRLDSRPQPPSPSASMELGPLWLVLPPECPVALPACGAPLAGLAGGFLTIRQRGGAAAREDGGAHGGRALAARDAGRRRGAVWPGPLLWVMAGNCGASLPAAGAPVRCSQPETLSPHGRRGVAQAGAAQAGLTESVQTFPAPGPEAHGLGGNPEQRAPGRSWGLGQWRPCLDGEDGGLPGGGDAQNRRRGHSDGEQGAGSMAPAWDHCPHWPLYQPACLPSSSKSLGALRDVAAVAWGAWSWPVSLTWPVAGALALGLSLPAHGTDALPGGAAGNRLCDGGGGATAGLRSLPAWGAPAPAAPCAPHPAPRPR